MERRLRFQLGSTFFGLTTTNAPQVRINLFNTIHQIVFHGKGGYDFNTIYNMPLWLRGYTYNEIKKFYDGEKKASENATKGQNGSKTLVDSDGKVNTPDFISASKAYKGKKSTK